jgi:hypothetical protein
MAILSEPSTAEPISHFTNPPYILRHALPDPTLQNKNINTNLPHCPLFYNLSILARVDIYSLLHLMYLAIEEISPSTPNNLARANTAQIVR